MDCADVAVSLPYNLQFDVPVSGTLNDSSDNGTGFTMALEHSAPRSAGDIQVSDSNVNGYEPSLLNLTGSMLSVAAQRGISYLAPPASSNNNNQVNSLGVGIKSASSPFLVRTTLLNIITGSGGAQAGIWYGLDEDNFVKLNVNNNNVELRVESGAISAATDQMQLAVAASGEDVVLELVMDPDNLTVDAYYSIGIGEKTLLGSLAVPANYFTGRNIGGTDMTFAGIYTTRRNGAPFNADFGSFDVETTLTSFATNVNFGNGAPPTDYVGDSGQPFGLRGNGLTYGWIDEATDDPVNVSANSRNRNLQGVDALQNSFIHIQYGDVSANPNGYLPDAKWEIALPNGSYQVEVGVGDPVVDSNGSIPAHSIYAEGYNLINKYIPSGVEGSATRFTTGSGIVNVIDGRLTIVPTGGFNTKINYIQISSVGSGVSPFFTNVTPENNSINVAINDFQANVELIIPNGYELDNSTLADNVSLFVVDNSNGNETLVPSNSNDTGGGDAVTLTPINQLLPLTTYVFRLTSAIEVNMIGDLNDRQAFIPFESRFTTGELGDEPVTSIDLTGIEFTQVPGGAALGPGTSGERFSSLVIGPDDKLYGSTIGDFASDGKIFRWDIGTDGTLSNLEILTPALQGSPHPVTNVNSNNDRMIIGLAFDPASTAENLIAYVSHNMAAITDGPEWDGKITRLSGPTLSIVEDVVVHLPRSSKDHLTNSIEFDANGDLYINQGSNSAGGEPDAVWANRPERLLSGAILKLEFDKLGTLPLDAYTTDNIATINSAPSSGATMSDGTYNPYATNSPLTIFSSGVRNAYDLVWHTNGWLYVPVNGTAGNGVNSPNAPSTSDYALAKRIDGLTTIPSVPSLFGGETQKDFLYKTQGGDYHGHPNPYRGEFVLNHGGAPYSGLSGQVEATYVDVVKYPETVIADVNYHEPAYDFGKNKSPNGVIEYKSDAFGGRLSGLLMVVRFSGQDDVLVLNPKGNGDIGEAYNSIPGLGGLDDPLDLIEDPRTGNIYVSEYDRDNNGMPRLTLLRATIPASIAGRIETTPEELIFEVTDNNEGPNTETETVEVFNTGNEVLQISDVSITGSFADQFNTVQPSGPLNIEAGDSQIFTITYAPDLDGTDIGYQEAALTITSDGIEPVYTIGLHALKKAGLQGSQEPTLQSIANVLGVGVNVGWSTLGNNVNPSLIGDEVSTERWVRASDDSVVVRPVARYSNPGVLPFGWYTDQFSLNEVGSVADGLADAQMLYPNLASGITKFDPGNASFGFYVDENEGDPYFTEDAINTPYPHRARVYPRFDRDGNMVSDSYFVAFESGFSGSYQDFVFVVENVTPFNGNASIAFDKPELDFEVSNEQIVLTTIQPLTLTQQGGVNLEEVNFFASEPWVVLPELVFDQPMSIGIDANGLAAGDYQATVTAQLAGFAPVNVAVSIVVTQEIDFTYKFNFQPVNPREISPAGYVDDIGIGFGTQSTLLGSVDFGWAIPGTQTPANASTNARNRNNGIENDPVNKTFNIMGHPNPTSFPTLDWLASVPNGYYYVKVGVGDPTNTDSRHILEVNGVNIINFDEQTNNPKGLTYFNNMVIVEVTDGLIRLSSNEFGVNSKINYIRFEPVDISVFPPVITANFDGSSSMSNTFNSQVDIVLSAEDQTGNDNITRLEYVLDGAPPMAYTSPIQIATLGNHVLEVEAEDVLGNITQEVYNFTLNPSTGARLAVENMTKIPGTNRGFPADDYYSFHRIGQPILNGKTAISHESNIMRVHNPGTADLIITDIVVSDVTDFTFNILPGSDSDTTLPITIPAGGFKDVDLVFITNLGATPDNVLLTENLQFVSNADNGNDIDVTLHGSYSPSPGGFREVDPQEVVDLFGLKTNLRSIVNTVGTISPPNPKPGIPVGQFPLPSNVEAGYDGDLVVSPTFVQADPNQPVRAFSLATYAGGPSNIRFIRPNSTTVVGGINFTANTNWYNTILSRNSSGIISNDSNSSINEPFRIVIAGRTSAGGTNTSGSNPQVLYVRLYKVRDRQGNIVPNEYIGMQDFSGGGGCGPCDWNDNMVYFMNIRPENLSSAPASTALSVIADEVFEVKSSSYINNGYPGNELNFTALLDGVNPLPSWMIFDANKGTISGVPPVSAVDVDYNVEITAVDLNGTVLNTTVTIMVVDELPSDLPWLEDFAGLSNGSTSDSGETEWTSSRSGGTFEVQNGEFRINGSGGTATWTSQVILIDGAVNVSIDIDDDSNFQKETADFIRAFYVVDGGAPVQFGSVSNDISAQTFSANGINGSTIQIIVESAVSASNETYFFDNISVTKAPSALKVSLKEIDGSNIGLEDMKLYPNPASTKVWLEWNGRTQVSEIIVYDPLGRMVTMIEKEELESVNSYLLDVSLFNHGLYFVRVVDSAGKVQVKKLLVKKE
ncbi:T9SS type A sorting domain-containing protein [uncultured Zobellia sp.]|uniref:T9SS type A sorting domain-containing protein n=1 Tax=uncultured Zobellia sp. TaxID=255433 RepID=UPI002593B39C|nr:T9SS type A sorting domain-containing protein [uncultured Zobellia sp.]